MKVFNKLLLIILLTISFSGYSQTIEQIGYYSVNGLFSLSSIPNYMVLGNGSLVDISNPSSPSLASNVSFSGFSTSVLVENDYAYFGTGMNVQLIIADISNLNFPLQVGYKHFPLQNDGVFGMAKKNDILYLAMGIDGIFSVDVSNTTNPIVLDSLIIENGQSRDVVTSGEYAYVAHGNGLKVLDISNPSSIELLTTIGGGYNCIDLNGNFVFLGKSSGGIDVFDITIPSSPAPVFSIPNSGGTAWDIKSKEDQIYLATNSEGLYIYKFNSDSAVEMASFANAGNGQSFSVALQDSLILLSGLINGVAILQYDSLGVVGIDSEKQFDQFKIFPNPAKDYIEFNPLEEEITEIEVINSSGKTVLNLNFSNANRLDISTLLPGNYILLFKGKQHIWRRRFIKID